MTKTQMKIAARHIKGLAVYYAGYTQYLTEIVELGDTHPVGTRTAEVQAKIEKARENKNTYAYLYKDEVAELQALGFEVNL